MSDISLTPVDEDTLDTVLAKDVVFKGTLAFKEPLMIKGRVSGAVKSQSDLYVDLDAVVEADVEARNVNIRGTVKGNIAATGRVEIFASGSVHGDVRAAEMTMEPGCHFTGSCTMTGRKDAQA